MEQLELSVAERVRHAKQLLQMSDQLQAEPDNIELKQQIRALRLKARDDQKTRIDRENWILNILRSVKLLTPEKKRQYYESSINIMKLFTPNDIQQDTSANSEPYQDFTELFVNLYVDFFEGLGQEYEFKLTVRQILRPTNKAVIVDLVRYLMNFTRDYFKQVALQSQCESAGRRQQIPNFESFLPIVSTISIATIKQPIPTDYQRLEDTSILYQRQKSRPRKRTQTHQLLMIDDSCGIYQIASNFKPPAAQLNYKQKEQLAITLFFKLKERNANISYEIENWRNQIFGNQKSIQYNYSNLYTKKELEEIQSRRIVTPERLMAGDYKDAELRNFMKAYIVCEALKQRKLVKPQGRIHDRYQHTIVLHHDHRYPLEIVVLGRKVQNQKELKQLKQQQFSPPKLIPLNNRHASEVKIRRKQLVKQVKVENKELKADQPTQLREDYSQGVLNMKKNTVVSDHAERCMVDRSKVLRIRKQGLFPGLALKNFKLPLPDNLSNRRQNSDGDNLKQLEPYTSRSTRAVKLQQQTKKQFNFRNVKAFTRSKNLDGLNSATLGLLRVLRQHTNE